MESDSTDASDIEQSSTKDSNPLKLSTVVSNMIFCEFVLYLLFFLMKSDLKSFNLHKIFH